MGAADRFRRAALRFSWVRDGVRLRWLQALHAGLRVDPKAHPAFAVARFNVAPGAKLTIGAGAATERIPGALSFVIHPGAEVIVEEGVWLRTEVGPIVITAWPGARVVLGPQAFLNACSVSAKESVVFERKSQVGPGSRIYDSDQHDLDETRPERTAPITVMRGVTIGAHSIVGAQSVVTRDIPPHSLAFGSPAEVRGPVGDRTHAR
jgi:hypothetical protein